MKCSSCQYDNLEEALFCAECGKPIEFNCPSCGAATPATGKFCIRCGHNLAASSKQLYEDLSFDDKLKKIQSYLPTGLTEKILAQRGKIEGERKQVTVMFCDLKGFTNISEKLGPDKMYGIMDQVYEILIHKVQDYEGTVNEMTGDGILALFGAPIALEDAPQRAIRAGMAIHRKMAKFSGQHKNENIPAFKMRIGIHTGPVVVGTLGNDLRVEFKAVGDTVNLASRMEGMAEPGTTYITEDTFKLAEGLFRFEALGGKEIKGKKDPIKVYRVIATSSRRTRFDVSTEKGLSPFVGRNRELELLLDGFERAKAGRGQAFSITSEAGLGKSRLLYEFRKAVSNEDITFFEGKCLSYSKNVAYHPVIDVLKSNFDIQESDKDAEIKEKVAKGLNRLDVDEASTLPYLLELLSVKESGINNLSMSPEAKKDRIMEAVKRITLKGSEIRPLIIAIEDLHWIDKSSEEYLEILLGSISGAKIYLLFTYRTEYAHTWGRKSYHSQINLNRISTAESLKIAAHLLDTDSIENDIKEIVLEKTEGIPFFIEEFVKSLKDIGLIKEKKKTYHVVKSINKITIPSTVQDVIMARVDSLPNDAKELLQAGSAIEREFNYELIKKVTGLPEKKLQSYLNILTDHELLYERGIYPELTYIFKHALTQEVIYHSILMEKKKQLHEQVGNAIEELYNSNLDLYYEILAEHFVKSENFEKGALYSKLASKKIIRTIGPYDAIELSKKRIMCLDMLEQTDEVQKELVDAKTSLGIYFVAMNYHIEAKQAIESIIDLPITKKYKRRLAQIYIILGTFQYMVEEKFSNAFKSLEKAIEISKEVEDIVSNRMANYWLGLALSFDCQFEKSLYQIEKVLNLSLATNDLWGMIGMKSVISYFVYTYNGQIDLSYKISSETIQLSNESSNVYLKGMAHVSHGASLYCKGLLEEAKRYLIKGIDFCKKMNVFGWQSVGQVFLGETYFEIGEYEKSQEHFEEAVNILTQNQITPSWMNCHKTSVAKAKVMNKNKNIDLELLYDCISENKVNLYNGWLSRNISSILLNINNEHIFEAEDWIKKAIESDKKNGMMFYLAKDYSFYANLSIRKDDKSKAKENLTKAIEIFKKCGADGWVEKYEKQLSEL